MPSSISSSRPLALALGLALFAGAEQALWNWDAVARFCIRHQPFTSSGDALGVTGRIELAEAGEAPVLVLLGSSQVREGIDCGILEARTGSRCVNLAIGGGSPLDMLHISSELGGASTPRTTVISLFPGILHKPPKSGFIDARAVALVARSGALPGLGATEVRLMGLGLLQSASPTLRHREAVREMFQEIRARWPRSLEEDRSRTLRRMTDRDLQPPSYFADRIGRVDTDVETSAFTRTQDLALDQLVEREIAWGHRVFVVDFPTRPGYETTLPEDVRAHFPKRLDRLRTRSGVRVVSRSELGPLSEDHFIDFTHLDSKGGRLVSTGLGSIVAGSQ
jgi:hypothetical protein